MTVSGPELNPGFAVLYCHKQEYAIIFRHISYPVSIEETFCKTFNIRVIRSGIIFYGINRNNRYFNARSCFSLPQPLFYPLLFFFCKEIGQIGNISMVRFRIWGIFLFRFDSLFDCFIISCGIRNKTETEKNQKRERA